MELQNLSIQAAVVQYMSVIIQSLRDPEDPAAELAQGFSGRVVNGTSSLTMRQNLRGAFSNRPPGSMV